MNKPPVLLAKTPESLQGDPKPWESLLGHTNRVLTVAKRIIVGVEDSQVLEGCPKEFHQFEQMALLGAIFHDLGKATNLFQGMLSGDKDLRKRRHPVRHEILTALLLTQVDNPIRDWAQEALGANGAHFPWMLSWVAGGHHLKLHQDQPYLKKETDRLVRIQGTPWEFVFLGSHPDVEEIIEMAASEVCRKEGVPDLRDVMIPLDEEDDLDAENLQLIVDRYVSESNHRAADLSATEKVSLALAKAVVIAADVGGSALAGEATKPSSWIEAALHQVLSPEKLSQVVQSKLDGNPLRDFQRQIAESLAPVTLTIAGCGSGKTVAAYSWAKNRAEGKKLFFCYPTTGTASAGFEDYLQAQSSLERALLHGRAQVDLERILGTAEDDILEENQRLESLKAWPKEVIACTVDTVLGLVQNQRRPLFSFPAIVSGAFVFDEIHNYDPKLFGALLRFLETFPRLPVLLMTASLAESRLKLLKETLGQRLGEPITGDPELETLERYRLHWRQGLEECRHQVKQLLEDQRKVLWVCNTVPDAIEAHRQALKMNLAVEPILYHSRFRYQDRVELQDRVIKHFKREGPTLVVSTQVCEMSLDISADFMVTALPPFPALIQRLGRLNRYPHKDSPPGHCLIYDFSCAENRPYRKQDLALAKQTIAGLVDKPLSQRDLANALEGIQVKEEIKTYSAWLDGVWQSDQRPLREGDASITVILKQDIPEIRSHLKSRGLRPNSHNVAAWTIPMYFISQFQVSERFGGYPVAGEETMEYDSVTGAKWRKLSWQII